jgi:hypothetical protein
VRLVSLPYTRHPARRVPPKTAVRFLSALFFQQLALLVHGLAQAVDLIRNPLEDLGPARRDVIVYGVPD